jgi:hypothetical protein
MKGGELAQVAAIAVADPDFRDRRSERKRTLSWRHLRTTRERGCCHRQRRREGYGAAKVEEYMRIVQPSLPIDEKARRVLSGEMRGEREMLPSFVTMC